MAERRGLAASVHFLRAPARVHAVVFDDPMRASFAMKRLIEEGFKIDDVHSPFPLHGVEKALGWKETKIPWGTLLGGMVGLLTAAVLQIWTHVYSWPLNIGGKTNLALPALVPVAFELTILLAALGTVALLFFQLRLYPRWSSELPRKQPNARVTDDAFTLMVLECDGDFDPAHFEAVVAELEPLEVDFPGRRMP